MNPAKAAPSAPVKRADDQRLMNSALPDDPNSKLRAYSQINKSDTLALLMKKLFDQNRIEDVKRASEDETYRDKLMKELGIN